MKTVRNAVRRTHQDYHPNMELKGIYAKFGILEQMLIKIANDIDSLHDRLNEIDPNYQEE